MSIQSIIGGQALALNTGLCVPPIFQRDVGLRPLLATALGLDDAERSSHQQDAVDGLPRRHRYRTACLTRIGPNREFLSDSDFLRVEHACVRPADCSWYRPVRSMWSVRNAFCDGI